MSDLTLAVNNGVADQSSTTSSTKTTTGSTLDKDAFLQLLVCQMQNQDPLQPNTDTEYVAQLATFSQLEQMQNLNKTTTNSQAFNLVGKNVTVKSTNTSGIETTVTGQVQSATISNGEAFVTIDGTKYALSTLVSVSNDEVENDDSSQAFGLVGKNVVMTTTDKTGKVDYALGTVDYISYKDGVAQLSVNGTSYPISQLAQIVDSAYIVEQYNLIGKTINVNSTNSTGFTTQVQGVVDSIEYENGEFCYSIKGKLYPCSQFVSEVSSTTTTA